MLIFSDLYLISYGIFISFAIFPYFFIKQKLYYKLILQKNLGYSFWKSKLQVKFDNMPRNQCIKNFLKIFGAPGVHKIDPNAEVINRGDITLS